jgi:glutamate--cysteine ligase
MNNIKRLIEYFESGCKKETESYLGLELEHIITSKDTNLSVDYYGEYGMEKILEEMRPSFDEAIFSNGHLIGLLRKDINISLEPGAQLEVSISRQHCIKNIEKIYKKFMDLITPILDRWNYQLTYLGYHPKSKAEDRRLLPKDRYKYMDYHFQTAGTCGRNMMRGTAATQISIDYQDEKDFSIKYQAACILGPVLALMTDNSPIFEGEIYPYHMLRQYIWKNVDLERPMLVPTLLDKNFGFEDYAKFVSQIPQIIRVDEKDHVQYTRETAQEIYREKALEEKDIELILSMIFPDVRLKKFLEIRVADSMPFPYVLSYAALIKGLFKNTAQLNKLIHSLEVESVQEIEQAKVTLSRQGYDGIIYGARVTEIMRDCFQLALDILDPSEAVYLTELKELTEQRKTLAQIYKDKELCYAANRDERN